MSETERSLGFPGQPHEIRWTPVYTIVVDELMKC